MSRLEKASHISIVVLCCVAVFLLIERRFTASSVSTAPPAVTEAALLGKELNLPGIDWAAADATLVLQISSTCHFCQESVPFYIRLLSARQAETRRTQVVVATPDELNLMQSYLEGAGLIVDKIVNIQRRASGPKGSPIVFLVNHKGTVKRAFVGKLDTSREEELLAHITR